MRQSIGLKLAGRTPFVKKDTYYSRLNPVELSCLLVDELIERDQVPQDLIQHLIWGMVVADPNIYSIAREVVLSSKLDNRVEAYSVSRACATSLQAATNAALYYKTLILQGEIHVAGRMMGEVGQFALHPNQTDFITTFYEK